MENFINGYPGHEHQLREGLRDVLGPEKSDYFFDKFLEYWFTEEDAKLFASFGFNSIRLPVSVQTGIQLNSRSTIDTSKTT